MSPRAHSIADLDCHLQLQCSAQVAAERDNELQDLIYQRLDAERCCAGVALDEYLDGGK